MAHILLMSLKTCAVPGTPGPPDEWAARAAGPRVPRPPPPPRPNRVFADLLFQHRNNDHTDDDHTHDTCNNNDSVTQYSNSTKTSRVCISTLRRRQTRESAEMIPASYFDVETKVRRHLSGSSLHRSLLRRPSLRRRGYGRLLNSHLAD